MLEKSEFKDDSQFFRFYADEETEGTSSKSKQLQRNDFKLIENIVAKSLVVGSSSSGLIKSLCIGFCLILAAQYNITIHRDASHFAHENRGCFSNNTHL